MRYVRVKTNLERACVDDRLRYGPEIVEFYLSEHDLRREPLIRERIRELKNKGIRVYLHHPPKHGNRYLDILSSDSDMRAFYSRSSEQLARICHEEDARCVIHAHYAETESSQDMSAEALRRMKREIASVAAFAGDRFVWEDTIEGLFSHANPRLLEELIVPLKLPLTVDVSHTFISFRGDNGKLKETLERTYPYARYYHLVDSMGLEHDSLPLGRGRIDWAMVKPYVRDRDFIFEIDLGGDHADCTLMIESARVFAEL